MQPVAFPGASTWTHRPSPIEGPLPCGPSGAERGPGKTRLCAGHIYGSFRAVRCDPSLTVDRGVYACARLRRRFADGGTPGQVTPMEPSRRFPSFLTPICPCDNLPGVQAGFSGRFPKGTGKADRPSVVPPCGPCRPCARRSVGMEPLSRAPFLAGGRIGQGRSRVRRIASWPPQGRGC